MKFEEFLQQGMALGINPQMLFDLMRDMQLNTLRNLLIAKQVITETECDELIGLEFKNKIDILRQLPKNIPPQPPK